MRSQYELQSSRKSHSHQQELEILTELEDSPDITQRELSKRVGIALGLTNTLVRNLTKKGYLRVSQTTWKRRLYTLTPEGFTHRFRLMAGYINRFLNHYKKVRHGLRLRLDSLSLNSESRIAIYGTGEFAELVYLGLREIGIEEFAIFSTSMDSSDRFLGMPVADISRLDPDQFDLVFVGQLESLNVVRTELQRQGVEDEQLIAFFDE